MDQKLPVIKRKNKMFSAIGAIVVIVLIIGVAIAAYFVSNKLATTAGVAPTGPASLPFAKEKKESSDKSKRVIEAEKKNQGKPLTEKEIRALKTNKQTEKEEEKAAAVVAGSSNAAIDAAAAALKSTLPPKDQRNKLEQAIAAAQTGQGMKKTADRIKNGQPVTAIEAAAAREGGYLAGIPQEKIDASVAPLPMVGTCNPNLCTNGFHCEAIGTGSCLPNLGQPCGPNNACGTGAKCDPGDGKGGKTCITSGPITWPKSCPKGSCPQCDERTSDGKSCTSAAYCGSCDSPTVDELDCGGTKCDAAVGICCPGGCKPKGQGCGGEVVVTQPPECIDTTWTPDPSTICNTEELEQTSNCGRKRRVGGTKVCTVVGACMEIKVYKKNADGTVAATPLTDEQLNNMGINQALRLTIKGSIANLQARFRVQFNGAAMFLPGNIVWPEAPNQRPRDGFVDPATKLISYYDFVATRSGTYTFEGFVSSKP